MEKSHSYVLSDSKSRSAPAPGTPLPPTTMQLLIDIIVFAQMLITLRGYDCSLVPKS